MIAGLTFENLLALGVWALVVAVGVVIGGLVLSLLRAFFD